MTAGTSNRPSDAPRFWLRRWSANLSLLNKSRVMVLSLLALFACAAGAFVIAQRRETQARGWTLNTYQVLSIADRSGASLQNMRRLLRDGLLSADESSISEFEAESARYQGLQTELRAALADNPAQVSQVYRIEREKAVWDKAFVRPSIDLLHHPLQLKQKRIIDEYLELFRVGDAPLDAVQASLAELRAVERGLLQTRMAELDRAVVLGRDVVLGVILVGLLGSLYALVSARRMMGDPLSHLTRLIPRISTGEQVGTIPYCWRHDEVGEFARSLSELARLVAERDAEHWLQLQLGRLSAELQLAGTHESFGSALLRHLGGSLGVLYGLAFRWNPDTEELLCCAGYGLSSADPLSRRFRLQQGMTGRSVAEQRVIELNREQARDQRYVPPPGTMSPGAVIFAPFFSHGEIVGVIELGSSLPFSPLQSALLERSRSPTALAWQTLARSLRNIELLELMGEQAERLQVSEDELRQQAVQLLAANEALRDRTETLGARQAELEAARHKLERHAAELERSHRYRSDFLANMSHELRTPLNSLLILSKGLAENEHGNLIPDQIESARIVYDSGRTLLQQINDLLDLSKIEANDLQVDSVDMGLQAFAQLQERRFRPLAERQNLVFDVIVDPDMPATIRTDAERLEQIIANLLANAFKFTPQGRVALQIGRPDDAALARAGPPGLAADHAIGFEVSDTGIGIPSHRLEAVFEPFEQVESGSSRRFGGSGLGLSISRGMASLLGGSLQVQSHLGQGSSFLLILPDTLPDGAEPEVVPSWRPRRVAGPVFPALAPIAAQRPDRVADPVIAVATEGAPRESAAAAAPLAGRHVLIVEDDMRDMFSLSKILRAHKMKVSMAQDGFKALSQLEAQPDIHLVLMDIMMPVRDGYETIQLIRERWKQLPIIAMTGNAMPGGRERCLQAGASEYCSKPIDIDRLTSLIARLT